MESETQKATATLSPNGATCSALRFCLYFKSLIYSIVPVNLIYLIGENVKSKRKILKFYSQQIIPKCLSQN